MDIVEFISTESDDQDLVLSFAIQRFGQAEGIESLILLRTPAFEALLDKSERGVKVSLELGDDNDDRDLLEEVSFDKDDATVVVRTGRRVYELDVEKVDPDEIEDMCKLLRKMNFDQQLKFAGI
jgi:adenylate cyclase class IV